MLEDRINVRNKRRQVFGTQAILFEGRRTIYPARNIDSIDAYRRAIGFKLLFKDYMKILQVDWDVVAYKRDLPKMIRHFKIADTAQVPR